MANIKLGNKIFNDIEEVKVNTVEGEKVIFSLGGGTEVLDTLVKALIEKTPYELKSNVEGVIAEKAFMNDYLITSVNLPSVTSIEAGAFNSCLSLTSVNMPSVTSIGEGAFRGCYDLTKADMLSVTSIGEGAFAYCEALASVNIPSVTSIEEMTFEGCRSLASVNIPSVTSIEEMTFVGCRSLASVNMPLAKSVGMGAFGECKSLTKIDLPSVTSIGQQAFVNCTALAAVILRTTETVCVVDLTAFANTPLLRGLGHFYVPASMYESYRAVYETAANVDTPGFFDILFRKIEDYPEITETNLT